MIGNFFREGMKAFHSLSVVQWRVIVVLVVLAFMIFFPFMVSPSKPVVNLDQHYIEYWRDSSGAATLSDRAASAFSYYSLRLNNVFDSSSAWDLHYSDPESVFAFVFARLPYYSIVYPTEDYYYFSFDLPDRKVSGNLRLVDLVNGYFTIGYFDKNDPRGETHSIQLDANYGVQTQQMNPTLFALTYHGKTIYFNLPKLVTTPPSDLQLLEGEEYVARVREESGLLFHLIFNHETHSFYYVLDESQPVLEILQDQGNQLWLGNRSGYVYYADPVYNRKLLIAISAESVFLNDYFDGPFDQVPPFLDLKQKSYEAYPYTQFGKGLDLYANFLGISGMRVAISPYKDYYSYEEVPQLVASCESKPKPFLFWECLTYEDKRDFHKQSPLFDANGSLRDMNAPMRDLNDFFLKDENMISDGNGILDGTALNSSTLVDENI